MSDKSNISINDGNTAVINTGHFKMGNLKFIVNNLVTYAHLPYQSQTLEELNNKYLSNFQLPGLIKQFEGRKTELEELESLLNTHKKVVISGPPGFGKTQMANKFARYWKEEKGIINEVVWVKFESNINSYQTTNLRMAYKKLKEIKDHKFLFVFDGVSNRCDIREHEENVPNYYLLITSTERKWDNIVTCPLESLDIDSSVKIFDNIIQTNYEGKDILYKELAFFLDNVPLNLYIIAKHILRIKDSIPAENFDLGCVIKDVKRMKNFCCYKLHKNDENEYKNNFYNAMKDMLDKVRKDEIYSDVSLNALYGCAFLDANDIHLKTLLTMLNTDNFLKNTTDDENKLSMALTLLNDVSLITYKDCNDVNIYKIIQKNLIFHLQNNELEMLQKCYSRCLKFIIHYDKASKHIFTILKYADEMLDIFFEFYIKNEANLIEKTYLVHKWINEMLFKEERKTPVVCYTTEDTGLQIFLENLITAGCQNSLHKIFERLGARTKDYINEFNLLHYSLYHDQLEIFKLLLTYEVNIENVNLDGDTPLHIASIKWNLDAIKILKNKSANKESKNKNNETPLQTFFRGGCYKQFSKNCNINKAVLELFTEYSPVL